MLVKLLRAPDADTRYYAAQALAESGEPVLAGEVPRLAADTDARVRLAAVQMGFALPDWALLNVYDALLPLLSAKEPELRLQAACGFAARNDHVGGRLLLAFLKDPAPPPNGDWRIMQAISKLAGQTFNYDIHHWGPAHAANRRAINAFESWLNKQPPKYRSIWREEHQSP